MGSCCSAPQQGPDPVVELNKSLTSIMNELYPGTNFICVLNQKGQVVADRVKSVGADMEESNDYIRNVYKLKKSAAEFANTVVYRETKKADKGKSQIVHIKGKSVLMSAVSFQSASSLYLKKRNTTSQASWLLAFYAKLDPSSLEAFDVMKADETLRSDFLPEIANYVSMIPPSEDLANGSRH